MAEVRLHCVASTGLVRVCGLPAATGLCAVFCREDVRTIVHQSAYGSVVLRYHSGGCGGDHECDDAEDMPIRERVWAVQLPNYSSEALLGIRAEDDARREAIYDGYSGEGNHRSAVPLSAVFDAGRDAGVAF